MKEVFKKIKERLEEKAELNEQMGYLTAYDVTKECIEIVNQVEEEYKGGWIPCSEELPSEDGEYLCCVGLSYSQDVLGFAKNLEEVDECDFNGDKRSGFYHFDRDYGYYEIDNVLAWQPLPAPYKGE